MQLWARDSRSHKDGSIPTRFLLGCPPYPKNQVKHICSIQSNKHAMHKDSQTKRKHVLIVVIHLLVMFSLRIIQKKQQRFSASQVLHETSDSFTGFTGIFLCLLPLVDTNTNLSTILSEFIKRFRLFLFTVCVSRPTRLSA